MSHPRYSIIPARAVLDKNLTDLDIRVLADLGIHTDQNGWCFKNQSKLADDLGVARQSVNRSLSRLYSAGYVEARDINADKSRRGLRSINCYRVILDSPSGPELNTVEALSPQSDNGPALSPESDNGCHPRVSTVVTPGFQLNVPLITNPLEHSQTPLTPQGEAQQAAPDMVNEVLPLEEAMFHGKSSPVPEKPEVEAPLPAKKKATRKPAVRHDYTRYPEFEALFSAYPARKGQKATKSESLTFWLTMDAEDRRLAADRLPTWAKRNRELPCDLIRYLRLRRWEDDLAPSIALTVTSETAFMEPAEPEPIEEADGIRRIGGKIELLDGRFRQEANGGANQFDAAIRIANKARRFADMAFEQIVEAVRTIAALASSHKPPKIIVDCVFSDRAFA